MEATGGSGPSACRYDVFLSFRGPDTRNTFTDCLYRTMVGQGIVAYIDSKDLHTGDRIDDLLTAIGDSQICIPVLSRGYASSAWCLRELAHVMDLNESTGKPAILPIFFDVTPLDVKLRTDLYEEDLKKHERRHGKEIRQQWEAALRKVPETKGWEVQGKTYGEVIELVVKEVLPKLKVKQRHLDEKLVGVDEQVESIMELLDVDSGTGVRFVVIHGMGGIGKTSLAKIVFNKLCSHFDGRCSFIENVRESSKGNRLVDLQKKLASDISDSRFVENFSSTDEGIDIIRRRACSKKVLLVLDDLDKQEQLRNLIGGPNTFCSGSRIIITTRDQRIVPKEDAILPYEVKQMSNDKALELFSLHAFDSVSPPDAYQSLSQEVVSRAGGLPLALKVIGSSLRGKEEKIWKAMLKELKKVPHDEVRATLKISYDVLQPKEKEFFLDIACLFIGERKSRVTYFWDACNLSPVITLEKLTDLCLIEIRNDDIIWMHDQLRDLGREIVLLECTQNRLWDYEEALEVVKSRKRKDELQALNLYQYFDQKKNLNENNSNPNSIADEELERMPNLKFLKLSEGTFVGDVSRYLQELRWFCWDSPPLDDTMAKLHLENLVVLKIVDNENSEDWGGWNILKVRNRLKVLCLVLCHGLKRTPDFSGCLSLEELSIEYCFDLQEIDPSIGKLEGLTRLNIISSEKLQNLPEEIGGLVKIEYIHITSCSVFEKLPSSIFNPASLFEFRLNSAKITHLPDSIGYAKHLSLLDVSRTRIVELPVSIGELMQLKYLRLDGCNNFRKLPESIGNLTSLQELDISNTIIPELPHTIQNLKQLKVLRMTSTGIRKLPVGIGMLEKLEVLIANKCKLAKELPTEIGGLLSLSTLDISFTRVCAVPKTIISLTRLEKMDLQGCNELKKLPKLPPNLTHLNVPLASLRLVPDLSNLTNLVELILSTQCSKLCAWKSSPMQTLQMLGIKKLSKLERLTSHFPVPPRELDGLTRLKDLTLSDVDSAIVGSQFSNLKYLSTLTLEGSQQRKMQFAGLELLRELNVSGFKILEKLSFMQSSLKKIRKISVRECRCLFKIQFLGVMMESLEEIEIRYCKVLAKLPGLSNAEELQKLEIVECDELQVVEGLEGLHLSECGSLVELPDVSSNSKIPKKCRITVSSCAKLSGDFEGICEDYRKRSTKVLKIEEKPIVGLPISIGELVQLEFLELSKCENLRELPESIGNLTSLQEWTINDTIIVEIPNSIKNLKQLKVLKIGRTPIVELPISIGELVQLEFLELSKCENLRELPESIGNLTSLQELTINDTIIVKIPNSIKNLKQLKMLKIGRMPIEELPISIGELVQLEFLELSKCENLRELPESIGNLTSLQNLDISYAPIVKLPDSIQNLKQLKVLNMESSLIRSLPAGIGMLQRLKKLYAQGCKKLVGELPPEIGGLSSLSILDISSTRVCAVPTAIISLTRLQKLYLIDCDELEELPKLPPNLTHLCVRSTSLRLVVDLSNLTNLVELILSTGIRPPRAQASSPMQTLQLQGIGKLSKLEKLTSHFPVPPTELGRLTRLKNLILSGVDSFDSVTVGPQFSNLKYLSKLSLEGSRQRDMQFAGLELLRELNVSSFGSLKRLSFMPSSLRKIRKIAVSKCPKLLEIQFLEAMMESLEKIAIRDCKSLAVLRGLSNAEALQNLDFFECDQLKVVEGLDGLYNSIGGSLVGFTGVSSNSKIPKKCRITFE